jgi:membrane-associated phospholipid phosphatase
MNNIGDVQKIENRRQAGFRHYWLYSCVFAVLGVFALQFDFALGSLDNLESIPGDLSRIFDLSELFAHGFGIVLVTIGIWHLVPGKRHFLPRIISCAVLPSLTVQLLKLFFGRVRPLAYIQRDATMGFPASIQDTWNGWLPNGALNLEYITQSFASAHTATVCGLAIGLSWVFPRGSRLFIFIAVLASAQRVVSLAHWSSDVCFGAAIALMMAGGLTQNWGLGYWLGRFEERFAPTEFESTREVDDSIHREAA